MTRPRHIPGWALALMLALAAIEPLTHLWLTCGLPEGMAHTGFHIGDTPYFLTPMKMFQTGFLSHYATCRSALPPHTPAWFALPHHWLYGGIGLLGALLGLAPFLALGLANGLCGFLFLWAVYRFLRMAARDCANLAFALFTLGGGLAGVVWLLAGLAGARGAGFEAWFHRFARYELIEGPFLSPVLMMPRLYYTLPLAIGFGAFTRLVRRTRNGETPGGLFWLACAAATLLNARAGLLFLFAMACYLFAGDTRPVHRRARDFLGLLVCVAATAAAVRLLFSLNPVAAQNVHLLLRRAAWFGALIPLLCWHLVAAPPALCRSFAGLPPWGRAAFGAALGYLACFAALYLAHQAYYGNLLHGGDTAAAVRVSDWALLGGVAGAAGGWRLGRGRGRAMGNTGAWFALWLLGLLAVSVSAWGQGWFMRFMPERCLVLAGVPLAVVSARGIRRWAVRRPRFGFALGGVLITCGVCSVCVSALAFQGPLAHRPTTPAFAWAHSEQMLSEDQELLGLLGTGTVLAPASVPPLFGDVAVHRRVGRTTVLGQPSLEFGGANMLDTIRAVQRFFDPETAPEARARFLVDWCVDWVYCPHTRPVAPETLAALRAMPRLAEVAAAGNGAVFRVEGAPGE